MDGQYAIYMDIKNIITELEYTKKRTAQELFDWVSQKNMELSNWSPENPDKIKRRETRYSELDKILPDKFRHELLPFAYYAKAYYGDNPNAKFQPCCKSEHYEGIIIENNNEIFVEITNAIVGWKWGLQKELLIAKGKSPDEHNIHGVLGNKTKRNRSVNDIITSNEAISTSSAISELKKLVKKTTLEKCNKSISPKLYYGRNKTILITTFDDTIIKGKDWNDFNDFKKKEIDSMKHNFKQIFLFGWVSYEFIS